jgi:hypothetical protein
LIDSAKTDLSYREEKLAPLKIQEAEQKKRELEVEKETEKSIILS